MTLKKRANLEIKKVHRQSIRTQRNEHKSNMQPQMRKSADMIIALITTLGLRAKLIKCKFDTIDLQVIDMNKNNWLVLCDVHLRPEKMQRNDRINQILRPLSKKINQQFITTNICLHQHTKITRGFSLKVIDNFKTMRKVKINEK